MTEVNILQSDSFRKSAFDGGTPIYPYGQDGEAVYLNQVDEVFREDLFQKHLELNKPKETKDVFADKSLEEIQQDFIEQEKQKTIQEQTVFGDEPYVLRDFNNKQVQILRKYKVPENQIKLLVENNFALPFEKKSGFVSNADRTIGTFGMVDGLWDNYVAFIPNAMRDGAIKTSQENIKHINLAIQGRYDEIPAGSGWFVKDKTLEELDLMRGKEQIQLEMLMDSGISTSSEWWQSRMKNELGVTIPLSAVKELQNKSGGTGQKIAGYAIDFAPVATTFSVGMYKNALKKYKDFEGWLSKFKKTKSYNESMTEQELYNAFMKDKFPNLDTATTTKGSWFKRFWTGSQVKTGMDIATSKEFAKQANKLTDDIKLAQKEYDKALLDHQNGIIDKQKLIRIHDNVRDLQYKQLSYSIKGVPKIFKQDAAMELGFATGAVTVSDVFGDQYEFIGGIGGGVGLGFGGNYVLGIGRTSYHVTASLLDGISTWLRANDYDVTRLKPEVLRNIKIYDKSIDDMRELRWYEFGQMEKFANLIAKGGPEVIEHINQNFKNYDNLVQQVEKVIGKENIHLFHEQFAMVSMLGPMLAARDSAQSSSASITSIFSNENPEFLDSLKRHQYLLQSLRETLDTMSQKATRGEVGEAGVRQEFDAMKQAVETFINKNQVDVNEQFQTLLTTSKNFFDNINNLSDPMWMDTDILSKNLERMDDFFEYMKNDPILSTVISQPKYQSLIDDVVKYSNSVNNINKQLTEAIISVDPTVPKSLESMQNWLAKSLILQERKHYYQAMKPYNKLYKDYKDVEIDGFNLFNDFWNIFGQPDNRIKGKAIFWRGNEKAPKEYRRIKNIFDKAAGRQMERLFILEQGDDYVQNLSPSLYKLEYEKWFKEKTLALAENLEVSPNIIDNMTLFEYLRSNIKDSTGSSLELIFNLKEVNKIRHEFQRLAFTFEKLGDASAGNFDILFKNVNKLLDETVEKYKAVHPNLGNDLSNARENYKYNYANRYLDTSSDVAKIGGRWITYSQTGKEFSEGPFFPAGKTLKTHPTKWINFNQLKNNPNLFRDQVALNIGEYVPGKGYVVNPTSESWLMWQAFTTRMIDEALLGELKNNLFKFTNGTYKIFDGEIVENSGKPVNTFHDILRLADSLTFDSVDGTKVPLYNVDALMNNKKQIIDILSENKNIEKQVNDLKKKILSESQVYQTSIALRQQQQQNKILTLASDLNRGLSSPREFVEFYFGSAGNPQLGGNLIELKNILLKRQPSGAPGLFKTEAEVNQQLQAIVADYISFTFGPKRQTGKVVVGGKPKDMTAFDFEGFGEFLRTNEASLRQILDEDHLNYLRSSAELSNMVQKEMMKIGDTANSVMYPGGLGIPAILSRIYGLARGVIGFRFVASELMIRHTQKNKGDFIKQMVTNKDAARVINEIFERGMVDSKIDKDFNRVALAALVETGIIEPESEKMDTPEFFGLIGIPFTDIDLQGAVDMARMPAEVIESYTDVDLSFPTSETMFPEGSDLFSSEQHKQAYEKQMENIGF